MITTPAATVAASGGGVDFLQDTVRSRTTKTSKPCELPADVSPQLLNTAVKLRLAVAFCSWTSSFS